MSTTPPEPPEPPEERRPDADTGEADAGETAAEQPRVDTTDPAHIPTLPAPPRPLRGQRHHAESSTRTGQGWQVAAVTLMVVTMTWATVLAFWSGPVEVPLANPSPAPTSSPPTPTPTTPPTMPTGSGTPAQWSAFVKAENALPGTREWEISREAAARGRLGGYADRTSIRPGEQVGLYLTGDEPVRVRAFRMGWYGGAQGRQVWEASVTAPAQPAATEQTAPLADVGHAVGMHTVIAPWQATTYAATTGWVEGFYLFRIDGLNSGGARYIPLTVRSASTAGRLTLVQATLTYQAYNDWGGFNVYKKVSNGSFDERATAVSFDRPYEGGYGSGQYLDLDHPIVAVAEKAGLPLAWVNDLDVGTTPALLSGAAGVSFGGHAEYWPLALRTAVDQVVANGGNLAVFGANTGYWRVRLGGRQVALAAQTSRRDGRPRTMVVTKDAALDPLKGTDPAGTTVKYRDAPAPRPEDQLMGQMYDCNPVLGDWVVRDASWWGFAGSGLKAGDRLKGVVGNENDRVVDDASRLKPLQVVAHERLDCDGHQTAFTAVYSSRPSGAGVFAAGTLGWPRGLNSPDDATRRGVEAITATVLTEFARASAGTRRPAEDTVAQYWLPDGPRVKG